MKHKTAGPRTYLAFCPTAQLTQPTQPNPTQPSLPGSQHGSKESQRTRFNQYATAGRPIGPLGEREKCMLFRELQARGFTLHYRWGVLASKVSHTIER